MKYLSLSIVIPVYNEEEILSKSFLKLVEVSNYLGQQVVLIFVNDGSTDRSLEILQSLQQSCDCSKAIVKILDFTRNFGHSAAIMAGLDHVDTDLVAIIDADLQDPPECIPKMIEHLVLHNADVVYGQRVQRNGETWFKLLTAWLFYRFFNLIVGVKVPNDTGDFRVMTREVTQSIVKFKEHDIFLRGLVAWVGYKQLAFPYQRNERALGRTKYNTFKMLRFAAYAITSFSRKPLYFSFLLGILGISFSFLLVAYVLYGVIRGHTIQGWASVLITLIFFQSILLIIIGIHGIYIAKMYTESTNRPRYLLRTK